MREYQYASWLNLDMVNSKYASIFTRIQDFEKLEVLGEGGFGIVHKARFLKRGFENQYVAIKQIPKIPKENSKLDRPKLEQLVRQEIKIHSELKDKNIVELYHAFQDEENFYLILEFCHKGSLEDYMKKNGKFSESEACYIIKQVIDGMRYLHNMKFVMHRDISLRNILLTKDMVVKIADFGFATKLSSIDEKKYTMVGTANFMPPEAVTKDHRTLKGDCWSVGIVLYALLVGKPPFDNKRAEKVVRDVKTKNVTFPDYVSFEAKELISALLMKNASKRVGLSGVLEYPFFKKYEKNSSNFSSKNLYYRNGDSGNASMGTSSSANSCNYHYSCKQLDSGLDSNSPCMEHSRELKGSNCVRRYDGQCLNTIISSGYSYRSNDSKCQHRVSSKEFEKLSQFTENKRNFPALPNVRSIQCHHTLSQNFKEPDKFNDPHCQFENPSCSHNIYCKSENIGCSHQISCPCQNQHSAVICKDYNPSLVDYKKKSSHKLEILEPLNALRLQPKKYKLKAAVVSINKDSEVSVELLKNKNGKQYISHMCVISTDGMTVKVYKPSSKYLISQTPECISENFSEIEHYSYDSNFPKIYWKMYAYAKRVVDILRARTPKITIYGKVAKFVMMENSPTPNYEMGFYDGEMISKKSNQISVMDKMGEIVLVTESENIDVLDGKYGSKLKEFLNMKKWCEMLEQQLESLNSFDEITFPAIFGKVSKENVIIQSAVLPILPKDDKSKLLERIPNNYQSSDNFSVKCSNTLSINQAVVRDILAILPNLKGYPKVINGKIFAEYRKEYELWISEKEIKFIDSKNKKKLRIDHRPDLVERVQQDVMGIKKYIEEDVT